MSVASAIRPNLPRPGVIEALPLRPPQGRSHSIEDRMQTREELIDAIVNSWCERNRPESMNTDWGQTLLAYGLLSAVRRTGNEQGKEFLHRWLSYHLSAGVHLTYFVGSWGLGLLYPDVIDLFPEYEHELRRLAERQYDLIMRKALRNGEGVILHNVDLPHIYIDTIYYTAPVLAKLGHAVDREDWIPEAMHQLRSHLEVLRHAESDFFIHCEQNLSGLRSEGAWGRGNGWVAMTCGELIRLLEPGTEEHATVRTVMERMLKALLPYQSASGLWRTIIDDPTSYEETSASAMFLFGMLRGVRLGVLGDEFGEPIERCLKGLREYVDGDARFVGASEGTWPGTIDYYKGLDRGEWWWGTGAYLLALSEVND